MNRRTILKGLTTLPFFGFLKKAEAKETEDEYFTGKIKLPDSTKYYKNGKYHRIDGPAVIYKNEEWWYQNGKIHRYDGPALRYKENREWYQNGKRHRLDGPAVMRTDGYECWYQNGKLIK